MTNSERIALLRSAIDSLDFADSQMQAAFVGTQDSEAIVCYDLHCAIEDVISTLDEKIIDLEK